jgi:antitoxin HicB
MTNEIEYSRYSAEADQYLRQPYARIILPEADATFRVEIMEFPGCIATGDSAPETLAILEEVARSWLVAALGSGQNIPEPIENNNDFSGRLVLRIPKSLHKKAAWVAEREGVSLNQFITTSLSESVGERNLSAYSVFVSSSAPVASFISHVESSSAAISGVLTYGGPIDSTAKGFTNSTLGHIIAGGKTLALMLAGGTVSGTGTVAVSGIGGVNYIPEGVVSMTAASTVPPNLHIGDERLNKRA